jgi:MerR family gold-responsive transcriptional activator of gol and ges genes
MYSIAEIAKAGRCSPRAIRYWEDLGLLGEVLRTDGDTRRYTDVQIQKARIISACQFVDWPLSNVEEILNNWTPLRRADVVQALKSYVDTAQELIEELPQPKQEYDL